MTFDSYTEETNTVLRREATITYEDGRAREIRLGIDDPTPEQVTDLIRAFIGLCNVT